MNYLYILFFKDEKHFKIGKSSKNDFRVKQHDKTYGVKISDSKFFKGSKKNISLVESLLLANTSKIETFNSDGHTEIRLLKYFEYVSDQLSSFIKMGLVSEISYSDIPNDIKVLKKKRNKTAYNSTDKEVFNNLNTVTSIHYKITTLLSGFKVYNVKNLKNRYKIIVKGEVSKLDMDSLIRTLSFEDSFYRYGLIKSSISKNESVLDFILPEPKELDKVAKQMATKTKIILDATIKKISHCA